MMKLTSGLYESLVTELLSTQLTQLSEKLHIERDTLRTPEAADRIALHLSRVLERAIDSLTEEERIGTAIKLARTLIDKICQSVPDSDFLGDSPIETGQVLRSIRTILPDGSPDAISAPLIPLLDTTLLTNAPGEPNVQSQLRAEISSADQMDVVMAFIRRSGILPLADALKDHCKKGRALRILTTTYTGSTEARALDELRDLGAKVRVSYDTSSTRLHAKSWLFHRRSGFSTAYIGSSNLTHSAQVSGLEWNVRVSEARNRHVVEKVGAVFESYWNNGDFVEYDQEEFSRRTTADTQAQEAIFLSPIEVRLEPFQERLLEQIAASRQLGQHRNLLVSATGTGKTVMAAVDYARLRETVPRDRLLFVAHREEILAQSIATFRHCLRDHSLGEKWVSGARPKKFEHVFASIQSLHSESLKNLDPRYFDIVIVDEFHHAAAPSYKALLDHLQPVELLGLTATPERSDGLPLLGWFNNRIAAELRLWDAIDQHRLCPFSYFAIHDSVDLREIPWRRGRGYDVTALSTVYTSTDAWGRHVISQLRQHVDSVHQMRCLGFCVSISHAQYMARLFREAGIQAEAVWSDSPAEVRKKVLSDLAQKKLNVVFSVDLFNEGIDIPSVDTLLLLRPTDSPTLFLQQLGRGLRRNSGKILCTVLDFIGVHRKEFRLDRRYLALLGGTRQKLVANIQNGFPFLPAGCQISMDAVAREEVLKNIKESIPNRWSAKVDELRRMATAASSVTLTEFLNETGLDVDDIYSGAKCWSDLREDAGLKNAPAGPQEAVLRRACSRLLHIDDLARISGYKELLKMDKPPALSRLEPGRQRLLRMLVAQLVDKAVKKSASLPEACDLLWAHPQLRAEILELLEALEANVNHVHRTLHTHPDAPLMVHARYTRIEILAALGIGTGAKVAPWQTGVYWAREAKADLLAFTLDKTEGQFSPTTRYRDYAISRDLIHWESQSVTRAASETGMRYQSHEEKGSSILLFARLRTDDRAFWFLGPATYVKHESEQPMAITWRLHHPLPGDLFSSFAAAVA